MNKPIIKINNLSKYYGDTAVLKDINLTVEKGDIYGLIGPSGAGKSTLLRCINGLADYQKGSVEVLDQKIHDLDDNQLRQLKKEIGMIFQQFELIHRKSVYDNIALPKKLWKEDHIGQAVNQLAQLVDIEDKLDQFPKNLSGGQKQRVGIARALVLNPQLLLSDEATSALDPSITLSILELLKKINQELGLTIILVSHEIDAIKKITNKLAIIEEGRIVEDGLTRDLFIERPPSLKKLLGEEDQLMNQRAGCTVLKIIQKEGQQDIFYQLAQHAGIYFQVLHSQTETLSDQSFTTSLLEIKEADLQAAQLFLDQQAIEWRNEDARII